MLHTYTPHRHIARNAIKLSLKSSSNIVSNILSRSISRSLTTTPTPTSNHQQQQLLDLNHLPPSNNTHLVRLTTLEEQREGEFLTESVFKHHGYDIDQMHAIKFEHRPVKSPRDFITYNFMKYLRKSFDYFTGYIEPIDENHRIKIANSENRMTLEKWLTRFVVLESIAGIPGAVAAFLRHLHAIRLFRRDKAFIDTLLDEAFNERMHLLTFLKMAKPTKFTRALLWVGQGIFANLFFLTYLFSPKTAHRFVGYLEEEAVNTYSRCLKDIELGLCPELEEAIVPKIAIEYWKLPENAKFYDLIQYIRADEAKHREVNHTIANLQLNGEDRNPFALQIKSDPRPQPSNTLENHKAQGWERKDLIL